MLEKWLALATSAIANSELLNPTQSTVFRGNWAT
jgi:hypothetical protein